DEECRQHGTPAGSCAVCSSFSPFVSGRDISGCKPLNGGIDGLIDFCIAGTATEIARQRLAHLLASRGRAGVEESNAGEDHPWCAISTLGRSQFCECFL